MKYIVPPSQRIFRKDEWYLLYDPQNIKWVKLNEAGYLIIRQLEKTPELDQAIEKISDEFGIDGNAVVAFVENMVNVGYLSRGMYVQRTPRRMIANESYPDILYLHMTYQCNLTCKYCYNFNERDQCMRQSSFRELAESEYISLIEEAKSIGVKQIVFTGGEPLLNKALFRIADFSKSIGLYNSLITNGTLISKQNAPLVSASFHQVSVSIDSHLPELNDLMRGVGSFERAMRGLRLLLEHKVSTSVLGVVYEHNIDSVMETQRFFREEMGCSFLAQLYIPEDEKEREKVRKLYTRYAEIRSAINSSNCSFRSMGISPLCGMCNGEIAVGANGDVFPCQSLLGEEFCGGNVTQLPLKVILDTSTKFKGIRRLSVDSFDVCKDCDFKYLCSGGCRAVHHGLTGDLKKTDSDICRMSKHLILELMWNSACKSVQEKNTVEIGEGQ
ncbi:MAG: radical SAM protein [Acidobacteria bacterium]|nr:radical SAM protein [Acidobacteriota bacterium]